jgi:hypothetical protein
MDAAATMLVVVVVVVVVVVPAMISGRPAVLRKLDAAVVGCIGFS